MYSENSRKGVRRGFVAPGERILARCDADGNVLLVMEWLGAPLRGVVLAMDEGRGYMEDRKLLKMRPEDMPYYATMYDVDVLVKLLPNIAFPLAEETSSKRSVTGELSPLAARYFEGA